VFIQGKHGIISDNFGQVSEKCASKIGFVEQRLQIAGNSPPVFSFYQHAVEIVNPAFCFFI
jgi:hypothetical protein